MTAIRISPPSGFSTLMTSSRSTTPASIGPRHDQQPDRFPYDIFPYVLITTVATNLAAVSNYYVLDADTIITGTADSTSTTTQIRSSATNLSTVNSGDIIRTSDGTWGLASANGAWNIAGYWYVDVDRTLTGFADGDTFTIYTQHAGPLTSEAVTNPLWDIAPATPFNLEPRCFSETML
jgi:hypothetical protein